MLIVSASDKLNRALPELFPAPVFSPLNVVDNVSAAERAAAERDFDVLIVNSPLPDDPGLRFALDCAASRGSVVLLLARAEQYDDAYDKLVSGGVFLLKKPASRQSFLLAADWLVSARELLRGRERKSVSLEDKMNEIRLVNRAKWLLIAQLGMSEPDAHRYIEKTAMDRCVGKRLIAEEIIKTYGG